MERSTMHSWTARDIPDQTGRTAVITGANSGLGFEAAAALAERRAHVVLAVRNMDKGKDACDAIIARHPRADLALQRLDLASLASVNSAADELRSAYPTIDLLINNAAVLWTPKSSTADGFELQFGTNHLGHYAFTGKLLDRLLPVRGSRVVTLSSLDHRFGKLEFDNLQGERQYSRSGAYRNAKLANLMFSHELQRRLSAAHAETVAVAAHPGMSSSDLIKNAPAGIRQLLVAIRPRFNQSTAMGALPVLRAATDPGVVGGQYYGPSRLFETRGAPTLARSSTHARDTSAQRRLWAMSEELTKTTYPV
jgi:NAD(P)-dependent dehydrogenase (short-subunit alcohol dehydrogenase family)